MNRSHSGRKIPENQKDNQNIWNLNTRYSLKGTSLKLSEGIFELRAEVGSDITRVLYFFYVERHIILTNGFIKKTQKTPPKEIERAKKYRADYLRRKESSK